MPLSAGLSRPAMNQRRRARHCHRRGNGQSRGQHHGAGLDPRFDLTKRYWLVAGIAGIDPADGSLGSAAWAEWVVDGDLATRSTPARFPRIGRPVTSRCESPGPTSFRGACPIEGEVLSPQPRAGGLGLSTDQGRPARRHRCHAPAREQYSEANARRPPFVLKGDTLSATTFWHGKLMNQWANDWVRYHTDGQGNYVTTAMEDTGTMQSLTFLAKAGRVDMNRVLVLRTASDYDQQPPGNHRGREPGGDQDRDSTSLTSPRSKPRIKWGVRWSTRS